MTRVPYEGENRWVWWRGRGRSQKSSPMSDLPSRNLNRWLFRLPDVANIDPFGSLRAPMERDPSSDTADAKIEREVEVDKRRDLDVAANVDAYWMGNQFSHRTAADESGEYGMEWMR